MIAAQTRQPRIIQWTVLAALAACTAMLIGSGQHRIVAILPMLVLSLGLTVWPPHAKHLKRVGRTLVAGTVASAGLMIFLS